MNELTQNSEIQRIPPDGTAATTWILAAGTSNVNSGEIDLMSSSSATLFVAVGVVTGAGIFSAQVQHSDTSGSGFTDIPGKVGAINGGSADSGKMIVIDINQPTKRFVRIAFTRGTANSVIDSVLAVKFRRSTPVAQGSTVESAVI